MLEVNKTKKYRTGWSWCRNLLFKFTANTIH